MANKVLVFRKFFSDNYEGFVSVRTDSYNLDSELADCMNWSDVELTIFDGNKKLFFVYAADDIEKYEEHMEELEAIRIAVTTTMDELVNKFTEIKLGELDDTEEEAAEDNEDFEEYAKL